MSEKNEKDEIREELESAAAEAVKLEKEEAEKQAEEKKEKKTKKRERTPEEEKERAQNSAARRKKMKFGTLATVITLVFIAIIVAVNVICNMLDKRFNWNIDLTSSGLYELDEQTVNYLHQLNTDVKITMLADESYFFEDKTRKIIAETMKRFQTESNGHIQVEYVDPNKNPEAIAVYTQNYTGNLSLGDTVVSNGDLVRVLGYYTDMVRNDSSFDPGTYQQTQTETFIGEQSLISAIMGVTDLHPVKVAVIDKMNGEAIYDQYDSGNYQRLNEILEKNNYEAESMDIVSADLTSDYDLAILCSPANDLTDAQIEKLEAYLNNNNEYGKTLLYFGTPFKRAATPNLDAFLETWGISYQQSIVTETDEASAQMVQAAFVNLIRNVPVVHANSEASLNAGYTSAKLPIVAPYCLPIETLYEQNSGRNTYPLLVSSATCCRYPLDESAESFDMSSADKDEQIIAVQADQTFTKDGETVKSQMIAFGSAWFLDYYVAGSSGSYDNSAYFISLLNTTTGKENIVAVAEKSLDAKKITVTESQAKAIRLITVFIIPLLVAVIGIVVYVRRKNL